MRAIGILCVWTAVLAAAAWARSAAPTTLTLRIPDTVRVAIKRVGSADDAKPIVDRVFAPIYRKVSMPAADFARLECGVVGFRVVADYCDCRATCRGLPGPPRWQATYALSFYVHGGSVYFSATATTTTSGKPMDVVSNDRFFGIGRGGNGSTAGRHFGPFRRPEFAGRSVAMLLDERALMEWALWETADESRQAFLWDFGGFDEAATAAENDVERGGGKDDDGLVRLTVPGPVGKNIVSFKPDECVNLPVGRFALSRGLTVDGGGGCAMVFDRPGCVADSRSTVVVRERARLYSVDETARRRPQLSAMKSARGCCPWYPGLENPHFARWIDFEDYGYSPQAECSCRCDANRSPTDATSETASASAAPSSGRQTVRQEKPNGRQLSELNAMNTTAVSAVKVAAKAAVAAALVETPAARLETAKDATAAGRVVVDIGHRALALLDTLPAEVTGALLLENVVRSTAEASDIAAAATPDTAAEYAVDVVLNAAAVPAFMTMAYGDSSNGDDQLENTKESEAEQDVFGRERRIGALPRGENEEKISDEKKEKNRVNGHRSLPEAELERRQLTEPENRRKSFEVEVIIFGKSSDIQNDNNISYIIIIPFYVLFIIFSFVVTYAFYNYLNLWYNKLLHLLCFRFVR